MAGDRDSHILEVSQAVAGGREDRDPALCQVDHIQPACRIDGHAVRCSELARARTFAPRPVPERPVSIVPPDLERQVVQHEQTEALVDQHRVNPAEYLLRRAVQLADREAERRVAEVVRARSELLPEALPRSRCLRPQRAGRLAGGSIGRRRRGGGPGIRSARALDRRRLLRRVGDRSVSLRCAGAGGRGAPGRRAVRLLIARPACEEKEKRAGGSPCPPCSPYGRPHGHGILPAVVERDAGAAHSR